MIQYLQMFVSFPQPRVMTFRMCTCDGSIDLLWQKHRMSDKNDGGTCRLNSSYRYSGATRSQRYEATEISTGTVR